MFRLWIVWINRGITYLSRLRLWTEVLKTGFPVALRQSTVVDSKCQEQEQRSAETVSEKDRTRRSMLERRQQMGEAAMAEAASAASTHLLQMLCGRRVVMLYSPFRNELGTWPAARRLESMSCAIALPVTDRQARRITPALVQSVDSLVPGAYGILEPAAGKYTILDPSELDVVVVPGACFDLAGYRIGYGGGYYDRFLPRLRADCLTVGFAYDWQVVPELSPDPWDQPLSHLVTDCRTIECRPAEHRANQIKQLDRQLTSRGNPTDTEIAGGRHE